MRITINKDMQKAMQYAVYMMIGDGFVKTECVSKWKETGLFINYKEIRFKYQYVVEKICINYFEKLKKKLPEDVWNGQAEVEFGKKDGCIPVVIFSTDKYVLKIFCLYAGSDTIMEYQLLRMSE